MATYNVHAGHSAYKTGYAYGAVGILNESNEARIVKDEVIRLLRQEGHTVYDCTVDNSRSQNGCLSSIVKKCNEHKVDLDISIHLNAGRNDYSGDDSTGGCEVYNYDTRTKAISDRICSNISNSLGIRNRGTKYNKGLYVLANTKSLALLVECCFVDDKDDADKWDAKKCAKAIVEGILNKNVSSSSSSTPSSSAASNPTSAPSTPSTSINTKSGDVIYQAYANGKWWDYVKNYGSGTEGYAGVIGQPLKALRAYVKGNANDVGYLEYRVHKLGGGWYNWQRDEQKDKNGENFAGDLKNRFDGLQMRVVGVNGKHVKYRVHVIGKGWLDWITDYGSGSNGYAGWYGYAIDAVQIDVI